MRVGTNPAIVPKTTKYLTASPCSCGYVSVPRQRCAGLMSIRVTGVVCCGSTVTSAVVAHPPGAQLVRSDHYSALVRAAMRSSKCQCTWQRPASPPCTQSSGRHSRQTSRTADWNTARVPLPLPCPDPLGSAVQTYKSQPGMWANSEASAPLYLTSAMKSSLSLALAFAAGAAADRTFVVYNGCPFTIW